MARFASPVPLRARLRTRRDLDACAAFAMTVVRRLPRIKETQTTFVLKEIKPIQRLPIRAGGRSGAESTDLIEAAQIGTRDNEPWNSLL
jgi:hypothetical protein